MSRPKKNKLVELRIDKHTTIWVRPEDATEEYAEWYRNRLGKSLREINEDFIS